MNFLKNISVGIGEKSSLDSILNLPIFRVRNLLLPIFIFGISGCSEHKKFSEVEEIRFFIDLEVRGYIKGITKTKITGIQYLMGTYIGDECFIPPEEKN